MNRLIIEKKEVSMETHGKGTHQVRNLFSYENSEVSYHAGDHTRIRCILSVGVELETKG